MFPVFCRPCPNTPRHGFVNSRPVSNWMEVVEMLQKATALDHDKIAEVILSPVLTGKFSAVATGAGVTWGPSNDSVTSGTSTDIVTLPVKVSHTSWRNACKKMIYSHPVGFRMPDHPYLELVEDHQKVRLVQIRGGPAQPQGVNHIPKNMMVHYVLEASPTFDLLEWEARVAAAAPDTVVYAPGMSLSSHYCVHAIARGIPVITDTCPEIGDELSASRNRPKPLRVVDYKQLAKYITTNLTNDMDTQQDPGWQAFAVLTAVATVQAQFCWGQQPHLLRMRGLAIATLLKAAYAASCGELRHWDSRHGPGGKPPVLEMDGKFMSKERNSIYLQVFKGKFTSKKLARLLEIAVHDFSHPDWSGSFGGREWANVARCGRQLARASDEFRHIPSAAKWALVIEAANRLINTSHNCGKCLTKWVRASALDSISESPCVGFLNPYAAHVAMNKGDKS